MEDLAPRLQDLLVELQLTSRAKINEALFASGVDSVLGALEATSPQEEFRCLLRSLGQKLNLTVPDFSPRAIDRNLDRRNCTTFKSLVETHRSIPLTLVSENGAPEVNLAVTDPLNSVQICDWRNLYEIPVRITLVSESDFQKYCLVLFSKLPLGERPAITPLTAHTTQKSSYDPEIEQIVGDLILAAARRGLKSVTLEEVTGVTRVKTRAGATDIEWRIPIVFSKATDWLRSISTSQSGGSQLATLPAGEVEVRFAFEELGNLLAINNPRFCIDADTDIEAELNESGSAISIVVASDLENGATNCWDLLKEDPRARLSRNRSDTLLSVLLDRPQIIIVDYAFPELNAPELLKNLNANSTQAEILVVLPEDKLTLGAELKQAGAGACIRLNELEDRLKAYLKE